MSYLSSNQLKQYEDEGFVSPINIFSKEKAKEIRNEIELIENNMPQELENSGRYNAHLISPLLDEVTHNSKILDAVQSLIGENNSSFPVFINPGFILFFVSIRKIYFFLYPFFNLDLINFSTSALAASGDLAFFTEVCPLVPTFP